MTSAPGRGRLEALGWPSNSAVEDISDLLTEPLGPEAGFDRWIN